MSDGNVNMLVRTHAERYIARTGRHPYTDCWPWAEAVLAWSQANEQHLDWSLRNSDLADDEIPYVAVAIAETLRLGMIDHDQTPGDLRLNPLACSLLGRWLDHYVSKRGWPAPGTDGWPEPVIPHADRWRAALLSSDPDRASRLALAADHVLYGVLYHVTNSSHRGAALRYRSATYGCSYVAVADVAPTIGLTMPVAVKDPRDYEGIKGLTVAQEGSVDA